MILGLITMFLGIQFLLGMYINLYVTLPASTHSFAGYITANPAIAAHIGVAFIIVVLNFFAFFMAISARIGNYYILAVMLSLVSVVVSGLSGMIFLMGGDNDAFSFLMAFFFILSFAFVGFGMTGTRKAKN